MNYLFFNHFQSWQQKPTHAPFSSRPLMFSPLASDLLWNDISIQYFSFKPWCQAQGIFCFSSFSETTQLDMARGSSMASSLLSLSVLLCCCLMLQWKAEKNVSSLWITVYLQNKNTFSFRAIFTTTFSLNATLIIHNVKRGGETEVTSSCSLVTQK